MRTTVTLDDDVLRAVEALRAERGVRLSEAINELVRRGVAADGPVVRERFTQATSHMGTALVPLDDVGAALELLEGTGHG